MDLPKASQKILTPLKHSGYGVHFEIARHQSARAGAVFGPRALKTFRRHVKTVMDGHLKIGSCSIHIEIDGGMTPNTARAATHWSRLCMSLGKEMVSLDGVKRGGKTIE